MIVFRLMATSSSHDPASKNIGKMITIQPEVVSLAELKPTDINKAIEVKVYRKWTAANLPDPTPTGFCCKGSAIQENIKLKDKKRFANVAQLNSVYQIHGFGCQKTEK